MTTANIMLYVADVEANADFWKHYLEFKEVGRYDFGDSISIVLAVNPMCNLQLFNIDFIRKNSPEVASNKPSLLFDISDFDGLYARFKENNETVGEIIEMGGTRTFNFPDRDGNYYAVREAAE
ncbi:VOC family protein [Trichococcus pasteurii]|uniref:Glyoxalase/bleomycin resistance protein/dihydroxybiphenyl dioxygenase n=1 Tax=Trichococcus pasteurii TaxID=43064 RepID=A0A1W1IHR1_9LACT|nr:VOC family protein [Trichococcus pasteurii]SFE68924.1 Glyoxalase-like domain-containing protein [Trichococcus pasteurii]SLM52562.1 glyoxalase/bleomycin resistance protein/dihydroxybiphenyl dioxygenase [Trichococcus pasteurii]SSB93443.1 glyoxalase/bleomycin resistance protein/dihydroxybiphenyl dioxygenase [Trichococcus pasteurii]